MINLNDNNTTGSGDLQGAADGILDELRNGPFAPALAGDILARYGARTKLVDLVKTRLADQVALISDQRLSPVGRPALALLSSLHDPAYWSRYRLSSLHRVWENVSVDLSALTRPNEADIDFARRFPVGLRVIGRVVRRSYTTAGFIVEASVDGESTSCFLPSDCIPDEFRTDPEALIGVNAEFEVASVLPAKRSVLLRFVKGQHSERTAQDLNRGAEDIERRLTLVRTLFDKGLISQQQLEAKQTQILSEL
jgi:hypothetical protein